MAKALELPPRRVGSRSRLWGMSPEAVAADQRCRIAAAFGVAMAQHGYQGLAVEHVTELAGISRRTFYDLFPGKAAAFCAAHAEALALLDGRVRLTCDSKEDWSGGVTAAVTAALEWAAEEPSRAYLIVGEPLTAGPKEAYCHDLLIARFAPCLRPGRDLSAVELCPRLEEALLAAFASAVRLEIERCGSVRSLARPLAELLLTPYLGVAEAERAARHAAAADRRYTF